MRASWIGGLAVAAVVVALVVGCGSGRGPVRIGVLADCTGVLGSFGDLAVAAAELPLLERGARMVGPKPRSGLRSARAAGRQIDFLTACTESTTYEILIAAVRRLVEKEHVDVVIGPMSDPDGLVVRALARRYPGVTFVLGQSRAPETTLRDPQSNLFRFQPDGAQNTAGLGSYAYHILGWRTATILTEDYAPGWPRVAGFVAEFCSLGGRIVSRIRTPPAARLSAALAGKIPRGVDGVALIPAEAFLEWSRFVKAYATRQPDLARHLVLGPEALTGDPDRLSALLPSGVVVGEAAPFRSRNRAWLRMRRDFARFFPGLPRLSSPAVYSQPVAYRNAMEATLEALARAGGDLSAGQRTFRARLAQLRLVGPTGTIRLDRNRQAIAPAYLSRVDRDGKGKPLLRTLRVVRDVEQTFGGYFSARTPPPSPTSPACRRRPPPPWAR